MRSPTANGFLPSRRRALGLTLAGVVVALGLAGCGSHDNSSNATSSNPTTAGSSGGQFELGETINYTSMGTTTDLDCGDGKVLNVGGSNNTLTVKGTCSWVSIAGADNKVTLDKIDKHLNIVGLNNTVTYKDGDPKVADLGSGNTVKKG